MAGLERPRPVHRQWTTIDGMTLVAATGLGLVVAKEVDRVVDFDIRGISDFARAAIVVQPILTCWAAGLLMIAHHRLTEPVWRLLRRPGLSACAVAFASILVSFALAWAIQWKVGRGGGVTFWRGKNLFVQFAQFALFAGHDIAFAWLIQLATGVWRPSPDWVDRIGRLLGVVWLGLWFAASVGL